MPAADQAEVLPISVVISTMDRPDTLARCLDALMTGSRLATEIVVVDQGDAILTAAVLDSRRRPETAFVHLTQTRKGLSASQNAGVRRASCPVVSIIDDDCLPDERWVEVAARHHTGGRGSLLLGGRVLPLPSAGERTIPLAIRDSSEPRRLAPDAMPWDVGTGGNFSVTRATYLLIGGNDERLGTGSSGRAGNDIDLFRRLMRAGVEARFEPDLLVLHERATPSEFRARSSTYGFGVGACIALWLGDGDRWAIRACVEWAKMRARLLQLAVRRRRLVVEEVRVLMGTAHGLWYGARLAAVSAARKTMISGRRGEVALSQLLRPARHPVKAVTRFKQRLPLDHRLPAGRAARMRRLLRAGLGRQDRVLVLGSPGLVRQVWPEAHIDVVGTGPEQPAVTVVSEGRGAGSLPRRWTCVVLTDRDPEEEQVGAAVDACEGQGSLGIMVGPGELPALPPEAHVERVMTAGDVRLVLVRVLR